MQTANALGGALTSHIYSSAVVGLSGQLIDIECDLSKSLPNIIIVGLANKSVDESKERIKSAITNSGLQMPRKRITLNLAPADLPKQGSAYDLGMTLSILSVSDQVRANTSETLFVGELSLDGHIRRIPGIISHIQVACDKGFKSIVIPKGNSRQARLLADNINILPASSLTEVVQHLTKNKPIQPLKAKQIDHTQLKDGVDLKDIYGQELAKRALEIAAAGAHNLLLNGPPGAGKTMLAKALVSILPAPSLDEIIEITNLHSISGATDKDIVITRPFRSPHHTSSQIALIGGGRDASPGEISLSHKGVLFLDEIPEYSRTALEALRQPLEDNQIVIARANRKVTYPSDFMLVATQNPCPCGFYGDETKECICTTTQIIQYNRKLSGPLLDRIDLVMHVDRADNRKLLKDDPSNIDSETIRNKVHAARQKQTERFGSHKTNSLMSGRDIKKHAHLEKSAEELLQKAADKLSLSARAYMKTIKVARTIADIDDSPTIEKKHITEALQYRSRNIQ